MLPTRGTTILIACSLLCSVVGSFFGAYPATGSFSRSAIKSRAGVRTPLAGWWTGACVVLALYALTGGQSKSPLLSSSLHKAHAKSLCSFLLDPVCSSRRSHHRSSRRTRRLASSNLLVLARFAARVHHLYRCRPHHFLHDDRDWYLCEFLPFTSLQRAS